jgi:hypothetical protein
MPFIIKTFSSRSRVNGCESVSSVVEVKKRKAQSIRTRTHRPAIFIRLLLPPEQHVIPHPKRLPLPSPFPFPSFSGGVSAQNTEKTSEKQQHQRMLKLAPD